MYDSIYYFMIQYVFNSNYLTGYTSSFFNSTINLNQYLSHTCTIIIMILFIGALICLTKWLFKLISGFILLK